MAKHAVKSKNNTTIKTELKHPLFFTFKICSFNQKTNKTKRKYKNNKSFPYFICNKCSGYFTNFSHLKRHVLQVELKKMIKCKYCGKFIKRIDEHRKFCRLYNSAKCRFSKN